MEVWIREPRQERKGATLYWWLSFYLAISISPLIKKIFRCPPPSKGERWFSIWERTRFRLFYFPDHMCTLAQTQIEWISSFTSCRCHQPFCSDGVFSTLLLCRILQILQNTAPELLALRCFSFCGSALVVPEAEKASLLCVSHWLLYASLADKVATSGFFRPVQLIHLLLEVITSSARFLFSVYRINYMVTLIM